MSQTINPLNNSSTTRAQDQTFDIIFEQIKAGLLQRFDHEIIISSLNLNIQPLTGCGFTLIQTGLKALIMKYVFGVIITNLPCILKVQQQLT